MPSSATDARYDHLKQHYLLWIVVRHFLSAPLTAELCGALIESTSEGKLRLEELFEIGLSGEVSSLATLVITPKPDQRGLAAWLQDFVRSIVWQNDQPPFADRNFAGREEQIVRNCVSAANVSVLEIGDLAPDFDLKSAADELKPVLVAIGKLGEAALTDAVGGIAEELASELRSQGVPLGPLLVKHLGDLCAARDQWTWADAFYARAEKGLEEPADSTWDDLIATLRTVICQSRASAARALHGPGAAATLLEQLTARARPAADWVARANAPADFFDASTADSVSWPYDARPSALFAPQLLNSHHLSHGLERWAAKKYDDARRWFWAVLRRQTALGSALYSRQTKAQFGHLLIEELSARLDRMRDPEQFRFAVRLLLEGASPEVAEKGPWSDSLVAAYVDETEVRAAALHAKNAAGLQQQRLLVLLILFRNWLKVLPPDHTELAGSMMAIIAQLASEGEWSSSKNRNVGGAGMEALRVVAKSRPEFRSLAAPQVTAALIARLPTGSFVDAGSIMETAHLYADSLGTTSLRDLVEAVLDRAEVYVSTEGPLPFVGPALSFLDKVRRLLDPANDAALRDRVIATLLRVSAASETQNTAFLWFVRDLDPAEVERVVDPIARAAVVKQVQQRATNIRSSGAAGNMSALLTAPDVSKASGVRSALDGLIGTLDSALSGEPVISFYDAYDPLMVLNQNMAEIDAVLSSTNPTLGEVNKELMDRLLAIWQRAASEPLIFKGFSIPFPTTPNRTVVHNWTFASLSFARTLRREGEINHVLDKASRQSQLEVPISVARAIQAPAGESVTLDAGEILGEKRDAFYAALGQRLLALPRLADEEQPLILAALLQQCYRLGPRGEDAAVFTAVLASTLPPMLEGDASAYRARLDNDRSLRLSLGPLWWQLNKDAKAE